MSFGLLKKTKPEKVQKKSQGRQPQISSRRQRLQPREVWANFNEGGVDCYHLTNQPTMESPRRQRRAREARVPTNDHFGGINLKIPSFKGRNDPYAYLEWEKHVELVFGCQHYSEVKKVQVAATEFCDKAIMWWDQLVTSRRRNGEYPIDSWAEMKAVMRKRFVSNHYQRKLHQRIPRISQGNQSVEDNFQELEIPMVRAKIVEDQKVMVLRDDGVLGSEEEIEPNEAEVVFDSLSSSKEHGEILVKDDLLVTSLLSENATAKNQEKKEFYQDQLLLESKNEGVIKQGLRSIDDSADKFKERYSLMSTPDSYSLEFKVVEEVDFVFGDSAFSKPENNVRSLLAEIMKSSREKQLLHFWRSKTEPALNIEGEKHKDFKLIKGREVAKQIMLDNRMFLKEIGTVTTAQRRGPIMDKVRDGRRVIETTILDYYGVPEKSNERILSLYLEAGVVFKQKLCEARSTLQGSIFGGVIMLLRVSYLQFMKDVNHPFDPGIQI